MRAPLKKTDTYQWACGGLLIRCRLRGQKVPGSRPDSIEEPRLSMFGAVKSVGVKCPPASMARKFGEVDAGSDVVLTAVQYYEVRPKRAFVLLQNGT
ncbi:hypothetical protein AVEN_209734-1 [Araneus ventricosus]|uniref:Uncharacterized protein n=1 Tax=Araneus ventricosus TaxID=182803 RepID=A0A4Y2CE67_ARAVE|nr:hypothetical protein AVEN_209734-1 [Araneus ventricosus]